MSEHQKPQSDILSAFQSVIKNCRTARDAQKLTDSSVEFVEPIDHVYELERCHQYQARRKASIDVVKRCEIIEAALPESGFNSLCSISKHVGIHRNSVKKWLERFLDHGFDGILFDAVRSGRPTLMQPDIKAMLFFNLAYEKPRDLVEDACRLGLVREQNCLVLAKDAALCPFYVDNPYAIGKERMEELTSNITVGYPDNLNDLMWCEATAGKKNKAKAKRRSKLQDQGPNTDASRFIKQTSFLSMSCRTAETVLKKALDVESQLSPKGSGDCNANDQSCKYCICLPLQTEHVNQELYLDTVATGDFTLKAQLKFLSQLRSLSQDNWLKLAASSTWSATTLAIILPVSESTISRHINKYNIKLHVCGTWCHSNDPQYAEKLRAVHGAMTKPELYNFVLSFDEKPCIQALEQERYWGRKGFGRLNGCRYKRHGNIHLLCILDVRTGVAYYEYCHQKSRKDVIAFFNRFLEMCPWYKDPSAKVAVILDNLSTHKDWEKVDPNWYSVHPNIDFLFTPTCSSWANPVESLFSIYSRKVLRGTSFSSLNELVARSKAFFADHNRRGFGYKWSFDIELHLNQRNNSVRALTDQVSGLLPEYFLESLYEA